MQVYLNGNRNPRPIPLHIVIHGRVFPPDTPVLSELMLVAEALEIEPLVVPCTDEEDLEILRDLVKHHCVQPDEERAP